MEEEQTKRENWVEEYNRMDELAKIARMKQHIEDSYIFSQALIDSPLGYPEDYDLLWTTWCIRSSLK